MVAGTMSRLLPYKEKYIHMSTTTLPKHSKKCITYSNWKRLSFLLNLKLYRNINRKIPAY